MYQKYQYFHMGKVNVDILANKYIIFSKVCFEMFAKQNLALYKQLYFSHIKKKMRVDCDYRDPTLLILPPDS